MISLAVDVGGTFTDVILADDTNNRIYTGKITSTPGSGEAVVNGILRLTDEAGIRPSDVDVFVHGFTIATNAWLTRQGARVVLAVTKGFRDVLEIGTQRRPRAYSLIQQQALPLVPRSRVVEIPERIDAFGQFVAALSEDSANEWADAIAELKPEAVAISFLFSHLNPVNEQRLQHALAARLPDVPVYCSSVVNPQVEEYPRTNTTVASAYVGPVVEKYLARLETGLRDIGMKAPVLLMRSDGGIATVQSARHNPISMLLSGPAGGVTAAIDISHQRRTPNVITFDMGGTSADFSLVYGHEAITTTERLVNDEMLRLPTLDISTISAGGGSIGYIDIGGAIRVGPESAGSVPGPAAYGRGGTRPTVTDAILVLGLLGADTPMADGLQLDMPKARAALKEHIADVLGITVEDAAYGMVAIANAQMARAIRSLSVERGYDPREFALLSGGGAGSVFAPFLMDELDMQEIIIPPQPGVFSAAGLLLSDIRYTFQTPFVSCVDALDKTRLNGSLEALRDRVERAFDNDGIEPERRRVRFLVDMRYVGQVHELTIPVPELSNAPSWSAQSLKEAFRQFHERSYGFADAALACEIVNLRIEGTGEMSKPSVAAAAHKTPAGASKLRDVYLGPGSGWHKAPVCPRQSLREGQALAGPLIIEQPDTTIVVLPGQELAVEANGVLRIARSERRV